MGKRYVVLGVVAVAVVAGLAISLAVAQERGGRRMDPEQLRQRYMERVQEAISSTDEEWATLEEPVGKVVGLSMEPGVAGGMRLWGRRGREEGEAVSDVAKAAAELRAAVDSGASAEEVTPKLAAYRTAREKARADLAAAREALKGLVSPTQEAALVLAGILD